MLKTLLGRIGGIALVITIRIYLHLPRAAADALAGSLAFLMRHLIPGRRRIAEKNVRRAFGETKSDSEVALIVRAAYRHAVLGFADALSLFKLSREEFSRRVRIEGLEHLAAARAAGRGVIGVSAHYGPFAMLGPALAGHVPFSFLYRVPKDRTTAECFFNWLDRGKTDVIVDTPRHLAGVRCLKSLGAGGVVCILIDQHFPAGVQVPFFGHPSRTGIGAALLAARSRAPLLPMVIRRIGPEQHLLQINPPVEPPRDRTREELTSCMAALTLRVESWIRDDPSQWFWVHRRWKDLDRLEESRGQT